MSIYYAILAPNVKNIVVLLGQVIIVVNGFLYD